MFSGTEGGEPAGKSLCWGAKYLQSEVFQTAGCNVDQGRFLGLEVPCRSCDIAAEWRGGVGAVAGEIKRVDTQIGGPLGLLPAVMHQSISRPLYYSDCAHYSDEGLRCSGTSR